MQTLPPRLKAILEADYPRFSGGEMDRRRGAMANALADAGCDHLVFCGANRFGSAVQWLTQWPVTYEAVGVFTPGERAALFVQHVNHTPLAQRLADADTAWGGVSGIAAAMDVLAKRGARQGRVAYVGPMSVEQHAALAAKFGTPVSLGKAYTALRQVKSDEELDWLRIGAHFSDRGMEAFRAAIRPGIDERELGEAIERTYVAQGGTNVIHFIGATSMSDPDCPVPRQYPGRRKVQAGDVLSSEISAAFWEHPGQVLRTYALGEPTPLYRDLHAVADAAFDAVAAVLKAGTLPSQVIEASGVIEEAGFTIIDDLLPSTGGR